MKNVFKLLGVIALAAVMGFSFIACKDKDDDSSGGIVISGTLGGGSERAAFNPNGIKFRGEVQSNNTIIGKLEDGDMIFNLKGLYDPSTKAFTMQAASSSMIFSIAGKLNNSNSIIPDSSDATLEIKEGSNWKTYDYNITPGNQTISGSANQPAADATPQWSRGTWYDQITGLKIVVTENSITVIDPSDGEVTPITIVEITSNSSNAKLLARATLIGTNTRYTAMFYVANSFDTTLSSAIGSTTLGTLTFNSDSTLISAKVGTLPTGTKMFVSPYCSTTNVITSSPDFVISGFSPMFTTVDSAKTAGNSNTNIKAIPTFTLALMH